MSISNTGGTAFPAGFIDPATPEDAVHPMHSGMTLRDYFAAKAMQMTLTELWAQAVREGAPHKTPIGDIAAKFSYEVADGMLKAREA